MGTAARWREERALEVEPERFGAVAWRIRSPAADPFDECRERVEWGGHRGRQERGHPTPQEAARHPVERGSVAHRIVTAPAVDMDIDEPGSHERCVVAGPDGLGGRGRPRVVVEVDRDDVAVVDREPAGHDAVIEDQAAADRLGPADHAFGSSVTPGSGVSTSKWTTRP